jgi:hypothetical protein
MPSIKIGDDVFDVSPLPAEVTFDLQPRLAPLLTEIGRIWIGLMQLDGEMKIDPTTIDPAQIAPLVELLVPAVERACRLLPRGELRLLLRELLAGATAVTPTGSVLLFGAVAGAGTADPFNLLFRGRTMDIWRLLVFALKVHYPDFLGVVGAYLAAPTTQNHSATSTTSFTAAPATASSSVAGAR